MTYFEEDTQLRDILITGGDALMSQNKTLQHSGCSISNGRTQTESEPLTVRRVKNMQNCNG